MTVQRFSVLLRNFGVPGRHPGGESSVGPSSVSAWRWTGTRQNGSLPNTQDMTEHVPTDHVPIHVPCREPVENSKEIRGLGKVC
jgi:hypothetical protein